MANYLLVPYYKQNKAGYCLPACAQMVLAFQGVSHSQNNLAKQLKVKPSLGAPTRNIQLLESPTVNVVYEEGTIVNLQKWLAEGKPAIVFVQAGELAYWQGEIFQHTVVIVGIDNQKVWLLDPDQDETTIAVSEDEFMLAWLGMDYLYAVISVDN